ncbi:arylamine N-acetyltransferase 1 [Marasmius fiardii PR-910]|nr:arylamine N-acetyltransferase 1 [Marasmius fiardii PR-910]
MKGLLRDGLWIKKIPSVYSDQQVSKWLSRIQYPQAEQVVPSNFDPDLNKLCVLLQHHIVAFPFENTQMHYTAEHAMDIGFDYLYERLVVNANGTYCFGMNRLFLQMIRGLGYRAYSGSGRINTGPPDSPPKFLPFTHMLLFIQPAEGSNVTYFIDASGGGSSLTQPILLADGESVMGSTPSEKHILVRTSREESSLEVSPSGDSGLKVEWRLFVNHLKDSGAISARIMYSFIEDEFFHVDYEAANVSVYNKKEDIFWNNVVCAKCFFLDDQQMEEIERQPSLLTAEDVWKRPYLGRLALEGRTIKRHIGKRTEVLKTMETELDRLEGLKEWFGIEIDSVKHMKGRVPAYD